MIIINYKSFSINTSVFFILIAYTLFAQIPRTISYQGVLTDASGNPKPDGDYNFVFSLYEANSGGDAIWSETKTLNVSKGLFSTSLGDQTSFGPEVTFYKPYWLGIKVGEEPELASRIALTSSGYSLTSETTLNVADGVALKSLNGLKDDLILEGGGGTTINTTGNTITISSSGTGGTGIQGVQNTNNTLDITNPNGPTATVNLKLPLILNGVLNTSAYLFTSNVTGTGGGILGTSDNGIGIVGQGLGTSGVNYGVAGNSKSPNGFAVSGWNLATTGDAIGVVGRTNSPVGTGIRGFSTGGRGVWGSSETYQGVYGFSQFNAGVVGESQLFDGVFGICNTINGAGVSGHNEFGGYGVFGLTTSGSAVAGISNSSEGVYGETISGIGVSGVSADGVGVRGQTSGISNTSAGVLGYNAKVNVTFGVLGYGPGDFPDIMDGVFGTNGGSNSVGFAGRFFGRVLVSGNFTADEKNFKIDHPLDPANKYLIHSCVESSERMNIYNGNVTTDESGHAIVELPGYFETLNIEYRYQLTVIGQFAQAIVESKVLNNHFTIRTDKPNVEVSWQVTGNRNDEYAKHNPFIVEKEKEDFAKGKYLHPEFFGQPEEKGVHYVKIDETEQLQKAKNKLVNRKDILNEIK